MSRSSRSIRLRLATRVALAMTAALALLSVATWFGMREFLDQELEANLLNVASIQAAAVTDDPSGVMRFHEWELTPQEATQIRELNRFTQIWSAEGESLLRSQFAPEDLPLDTAALRRASEGSLITLEQEYLGLDVRSLYYPLERLGPLHAHHVLQVAAPLEGRNEILRRLAWLLAGVTALVGLATFAGGWWLALGVIRPVNRIIDQAESMEPQTLHRRIDAHADTREYQRLVRVLNSMLERLDPHTVYITPERMRQVREDFNASFEGIGIAYEFIDGPGEADDHEEDAAAPFWCFCHCCWL